MGYESKFMICRESSYFPETIDGKEYFNAEIIAMFDMCKMGDGDVYKVIKHSPPSGCSMHIDGKTVCSDMYDDPLCRIDPYKLKTAIENDAVKWEYWRYAPFLKTLNAYFAGQKFFYNPKKDVEEKLIILHFGY